MKALTPATGKRIRGAVETYLPIRVICQTKRQWPLSCRPRAVCLCATDVPPVFDDGLEPD